MAENFATDHAALIKQLAAEIPGFQTSGWREAIFSAFWDCPGPDACEEDTACKLSPSARASGKCAAAGGLRNDIRAEARGVPDGFAVDADAHRMTVYEVEVTCRLNAERLAKYADVWWWFDSEGWDFKLICVGLYGGRKEIDLQRLWFKNTMPEATEAQRNGAQLFFGLKTWTDASPADAYGYIDYTIGRWSAGCGELPAEEVRRIVECCNANLQEAGNDLRICLPGDPGYDTCTPRAALEDAQQRNRQAAVVDEPTQRHAPPEMGEQPWREEIRRRIEARRQTQAR